MSITVPNFSASRVLVVGDVMLDRSWHGATNRISPEAPVPVVHVGQQQDVPGGAANVALNVASLGAAISLVGAIGGDEAGEILTATVSQHGVNSQLVVAPGVSTITKLRMMSRRQQLLRADFEDSPAGYNVAELVERAKSLLPGVSVMVLSDYAKGVLTDPQPFIKAARAGNVAIVIDPKGADFSRYRGATLLTPNMSEFEAVVGPCANDEDIVTKARKLIEKFDLQAMLVTRSEQGMSLIPREGEPLHLPTRAQEVYDVTGAGDTVIATLAASMAAGESMSQAAVLANAAAGIVVAKTGTASITVDELRAAVRPHRAYRGVMTEDEVRQGMVKARADNEKVVFTNGCFDILHAGHVSYLEQARALGDRLIVAVNSDASVARLKGDDRPLNSVEDRMAVLAGLASCDWVVPFEEDTPARLIGELLPDVLVKGGDYQPDEIAGAEAVIANGGSVEVLGFLDGRSTTKLINRIKER